MKKVIPVLILACYPLIFLSAQEVSIPDAKFLYALIDEGVDSNGDSIITTGEAETVTFLDVSSKAITDITGLEAFVNLDTLYCDRNGITLLDLTALTGLQKLNCGFNNLTNLDLSMNVQLLDLDCQNNQMESLDVSQCPELHTLLCFLNHLTTLDVSGNTALRVLECYNNNLAELDVTSNSLLEELACVSNQLSALDVRGNPELRYLNCADNHLSELDLSGNDALYFLHCEQNQLEHLDVSYCEGLIALECQGNRLDTLDVTANTGLTYLDCGDNLLAGLDVTLNVSLLFLGCRDNMLEHLNVSNNIALKTIDCSNNMLNGLDVTANTVLTELRCYDNDLTCLDLSGSIQIERLDCSGNQLVSIDLRHFRGCDWFNCISLRNMSTLRQVCLSDLSYSFLISLTGSSNAYFTTDCQDIEAPRIFSEDSVVNREEVKVTCNEEATIYLVPENTEQDLPVIRAAAIDSMVIASRTETGMALEGIDNGIYWLYAADSSGNVSDPWSFILYRVSTGSIAGEMIRIYPVPFDEVVTVSRDGDRPVAIRVITLNGITVHRAFYPASPVTIDLGHLERGVYILNVEMEGKQLYRRIVKL